MKIFKTIFLLLAISVTSFLNAQQLIQIKDASIDFDDKERPCIQINVDPEPEFLKEEWRDYLDDNYGFKLKGIGFLSNKDLLSAKEIEVEELSSRQIDFFTRVVEDENGSEMKVFVRFGYDIYLSRSDNPSEYNTLRNMVEAFLKEYLPAHYNEQLKETKDRIDDLIDEAEGLEEEISDNTSEIANLKDRIKDLEDNLKSKNEKLTESKSKLKNRQAKLERIKAQTEKL